MAPVAARPDPPQAPAVDLHVEADPERPGGWRVTAGPGGHVLSRHLGRPEAVDAALGAARRGAGPADVEIDAAGKRRPPPGSREDGPGEDGGGAGA